MADQDHLERINALPHNAQQKWFALLAALAFVGVASMGVKHFDFYSVHHTAAEEYRSSNVLFFRSGTDPYSRRIQLFSP